MKTVEIATNVAVSHNVTCGFTEIQLTVRAADGREAGWEIPAWSIDRPYEWLLEWASNDWISEAAFRGEFSVICERLTDGLQAAPASND
jgi:hypothetical protein